MQIQTRVRRFLIAAALLPCTVFAQKTGSIEGRVTITQALRESPEIVSQQIIRQYSLASGRYSDLPDNAREMPPSIIVYLESTENAPKNEAVRQRSFVIMDQKNERFVPHMLAIERGTEVRFLNSDSIYHNVFSLSPAKSFDLGRYPQGKFRSVLFDKAGLIKVYCDIHTHMSAYIQVLDTPYFAMTRSDGTFSLAEIPPGAYEFFARYGKWQSKPVVVTVVADQTSTVTVALP